MDIIYTKMWENLDRVLIFIQKNSFHYSLLLKHFKHISLRGLMVSALDSHAVEPGLIPGVDIKFYFYTFTFTQGLIPVADLS